MSGLARFENYHYIPGPFQYSGGVVAAAGYAIERVRFANPLPLLEGFARVESFLKAAGQPLTSFCACELRSPAPFSEAGFTAFNRDYVGTLERWGIFRNDTNPVARSNVCPEIDPPKSPSLHAFSYVRPADADLQPSFVVAGSGESGEGGSYSDRTVRFGDTSPEAILEKAVFVHGAMERRMAALGTGWAATTGVQVYTVHDIFPFLASDIVSRGACRHGVTWHLCRPPVVNLEYEMDCRGVGRERVLQG